ncbi:Uncharacterised protein [Streptococcus pneumoniae]|nr:Uncharacterised protein [Streptococcus pneumoniae]
MAAKSFTPSHLPTTTIPNNCPTDCSTLLNSNGTKNMDIDFQIGLLSLSNLCDSAPSLLLFVGGFKFHFSFY